MIAARTFYYTARTLDGGIVRGSMQAADAGAVLALLRSRALIVTAIAADTDVGGRLHRALRPGRIARTALLTFFRSFATLFRAGVPVARALGVAIERATDTRLLEALRSVLADVEHGSPLSDALGRRPRDFPPLYVAMIRAGETGGILDDVLDRLALLLERESALRKKLQTALAYPLVVIVAAIGLVLFLIADIVPMFAQMFDSFHVELPLGTRLLLSLGRALAGPLPWIIIVGSLGMTVSAAYRLIRLDAGAVLADRLRLGLPIVGPLVHKAITARVARMLGTLLRSGVELVAAIDAVAAVAGSPIYARAFERVTSALRDGRPLTGPLAESGLFDPLFVALVRTGEETGLLDDMLLKLAEYYEADVDAAIATLGAVIEPALIVVLGGVVGFIVFSIFLPLYSLIGNVAAP